MESEQDTWNCGNRHFSFYAATRIWSQMRVRNKLGIKKLLSIAR